MYLTRAPPEITVLNVLKTVFRKNREYEFDVSSSKLFCIFLRNFIPLNVPRECRTDTLSITVIDYVQALRTAENCSR